MAPTPSNSEESAISPSMIVELGQTVLAICGPGENYASPLITISSLRNNEPSLSFIPISPLKIAVCRSSPISPLIFDTNIASLRVDLAKSDFDGVQLWADDVSQFIGRSFGDTSETNTERGLSRNPSLIGSRFFARNGNKSTEGSSAGLRSQIAVEDTEKLPGPVVKVVVQQGELRTQTNRLA